MNWFIPNQTLVGVNKPQNPPPGAESVRAELLGQDKEYHPDSGSKGAGTEASPRLELWTVQCARHHPPLTNYSHEEGRKRGKGKYRAEGAGCVGFAPEQTLIPSQKPFFSTACAPMWDCPLSRHPLHNSPMSPAEASAERLRPPVAGGRSPRRLAVDPSPALKSPSSSDPRSQPCAGLSPEGTLRISSVSRGIRQCPARTQPFPGKAVAWSSREHPEHHSEGDKTQRGNTRGDTAMPDDLHLGCSEAPLRRKKGTTG